MAAGVRHPYSHDLYEPDEGRVRITRHTGEVGYYTSAGRWLEGDRFDADPHLCGWVSSPRAGHRISSASR